MSAVLVVLEHDRGEMHLASLEALTAGRDLAGRLGVAMHAVVVGGGSVVGDVAGVPDMATVAGSYGATSVHHVKNAMLSDYGPEAWGEAIAKLVTAVEPSAVVAVGTDRGNEVMAQAAARLDLAFVANCVSVDPAGPGETWTITRSQWGGSLLEDASLVAETTLLTFAYHSVEPTTSGADAFYDVVVFDVELGNSLARTMIVDRVVLESGVTLATAPVVVSGGRGVGSGEGFAAIEELAELLGGRVGCSRAVTNNGWRPHSDQVGQTGTRIAPELYIACGISGAIQHWVGAMASKNILAINTDPEANIVTKAGYAVIADLHEVVPAIVAELHRRRR